MKKTIPISGLIAAILSIMGMIMKMMHWEGSDICLVTGFLLFAFLFLPVYGYKLLYNFNGKKSKFAGVCGSILFMFIALATLFKIEHFSGAAIMLVVEFGVLAFIILPMMMISKVKSSASGKEKTLQIFWYVALILLSLGYHFKMMHWLGAGPLLLLGTLIMSLGYLPLAFQLYNNEQHRNKLYSRFVIVPSILVFSLLLATGVSKSIFNSFETIDEGIMQSERFINDDNIKMYSTFSDGNNDRTQKRYLKAKKVKELSDDLYEHIEKLKIYLMRRTDGVFAELPDSSVKLASLDMKDNSDIPSMILIGDAENPKKGAWSAIELKAKIFVYREDLLSMFPKGVKEIENETMGLHTDDIYLKEEERKVTWEYGMFYNIPIAAIITKLSLLQNDIRYAESQTLIYLTQNRVTF